MIFNVQKSGVKKNFEEIERKNWNEIQIDNDQKIKCFSKFQTKFII